MTEKYTSRNERDPDVYKAGDFTSGKMSEIFKQCFIKDLAKINHKQHGMAYMIPEEIIRVLALVLFDKVPGGREYALVVSPKKGDFIKLHQDDQMHAIEDFYNEEFDSWFGLVCHICTPLCSK